MWRLGVSVTIAWLIFDRLAKVTGSLRGEAGVLIAAVVLATIVVLDRVVLGRPWGAALRGLGLGRPRARGVVAALGLGALLLSFFPLYARATGARVVVDAGALALLPGLFAQGGLAEEALFRAFLFGHLRERYPFWRAAKSSLVPFAAVHVLLFATLPAGIAAAATLLAVVMSFPLARLYELGGGTIWAPALVHFVAQTAIKLVTVQPAPAVPLGLPWMAACLVVPWLAFVPLSARRSASNARA